MAAPRTSGEEWLSPFGMRTFITGFWRFFLSFYAHPSAILPRSRNPVLILLMSSALIRAIEASKSMGYIFLDFIDIDMFSMNQRAISWTGSPSSCYSWPKGSLQTWQIT